jgi:putative component of toxin-antitoxin plasmid stabilization module
MHIEIDDLYRKDCARLKNAQVEKKIEKAVNLLKENEHHPSLQNKQVVCRRADNLFSIRVDKGYRILYLRHKSFIVLYRLLDHDTYDRLIKNC